MLLVPFDLSRREGDGQIGSESDGAAVVDQGEGERALGRKMETEEEASEIRGLSPHRAFHPPPRVGLGAAEGITRFLSSPLLRLRVAHNGTETKHSIAALKERETRGAMDPVFSGSGSGCLPALARAGFTLEPAPLVS